MKKNADSSTAKAPSPSRWTISVVALNGDEVASLSVSSNDPVRLLREHLAEASGTLPHLQRLILSDERLNAGVRRVIDQGSNDRTLGQAGLCDGARLTLVAMPNDSILTTSLDCTVRVWSAATGLCVHKLTGHEDCVFSVDCEGLAIVSASRDCTAILWSAVTGACLQVFRGHTAAVRWAALAPNGKLVASASDDCTARLWSRGSGRCVSALAGHTEGVRAVFFLPDSKSVFTASEDHTARHWAVSTGECLRVLRGHSGGVCASALSQCGSTFATGSRDGSTCLWSVQSGKCSHTLIGRGEKSVPVLVVKFTSDAQVKDLIDNQTEGHLVTLNESSAIHWWDVLSGDCILTLQNVAATSIACSPNGKYLATGRSSGSLMLSTTHLESALVRRGIRLRQFTGHTGAVISESFAPDFAWEFEDYVEQAEVDECFGASPSLGREKFSRLRVENVNELHDAERCESR